MYRNQFINLYCKLMDSSVYDRDVRHEGVKITYNDKSSFFWSKSVTIHLRNIRQYMQIFKGCSETTSYPPFKVLIISFQTKFINMFCSSYLMTILFSKNISTTYRRVDGNGCHVHSSLFLVINSTQENYDLFQI